MLRMRLTKHAVDALQAGEDEIRIWDTTVAGFGIRCRGGGSKFYFLKYRLPSGRQRWATVGRHGSPWTVETARRVARRLSGQIVDGEDPVEAKAVERTDLTLSQLCDLYLAQPNCHHEPRDRQEAILARDRPKQHRATYQAVARSGSTPRARPGRC